jgi:hypothetical protein
MKLQIFMLLLLISTSCINESPENEYNSVPLKSEIKNVQPMTGIVLWNTHSQCATEAISLEFTYCLYKDIVRTKGVYDWTELDKLLTEVAARKHQAIVRFRYVYPGDNESAVPLYIRDLTDYEETKGSSEGSKTCFPDWRHPELQRFHLEFYQKLAERYDTDKRLAFLQTGFGLWAEYHIYDGPFTIGKTFPSKDFQKKFLLNMSEWFIDTPWSVSIDAADSDYSPFAENKELKKLKFGLFDDSFMHEKHGNYNTECWNFFDRERYATSPAGGEFGYYKNYDQEHVLDYPDGIYGRNFESEAKVFHISYMIGNDQPQYQSITRIKEASMACGYRYEIIEFSVNGSKCRVVVRNKGVAPIYRDAYVAVDGVRASESLKLLQPGQEAVYEIGYKGENPVLTIECDHLVDGQKIEIEAKIEDLRI